MNAARVLLLAAVLAMTVVAARPAALTPTARADGWCIPLIVSSAGTNAGVFCKPPRKKPNKAPTRCTDQWAQFRTLNAQNFRWNLCVLTNRNPSTHDAHHVFPKVYEMRFATLTPSIPVHNPAMGTWWERGAHQRASHRYNVVWARFLTNPRLTGNQAVQFGCALARRYRFMVMFSCYNGPH